MRACLFLLVLLVPAVAAAQSWPSLRPPAAEGFAYPECYCTNRGVRVEMGQTACLQVDGKTFTARCAMSLNNPTWRREADGCAEGISLAPWAPAPPANLPPARG